MILLTSISSSQLGPGRCGLVVCQSHLTGPRLRDSDTDCKVSDVFTLTLTTTSDPNRLLNRGHLQIHYFGFMRRMLDCCYLGTVLCYIVKILDFTWLTWFIIARNKHPVLWTMYDQPRTFAWLERRRGAVTILPCIHFSSFPGKTKTKAEGGKLRASKNAKSFKLKMN